MHDPRLDQLAKVLVRYSTSVKPGDEVVITGSPVAEPAIVATCREVLAAGGHPWVRIQSDDAKEVMLKHGGEEQLKHVSPFDRYVMDHANAYISFWGEDNTRSFTNVKPERQALMSQGRKPILRSFMKRAALPEKDPKFVRWVGTQMPTNANAQDAEMSLGEYADFVFGGCRLNERNPVQVWKRLGVAQQRLCDFLNKGRVMRLRAPGGTDVTFGIKGRKWINCEGKNNFPDGEVFTGPIEDSAEGTIVYTFPAVAGGREVTDVRLVFKAGKVVEATASKNEKFLHEMIDQDRGARFVGELALGTNYGIKQFTRNTLFDEKIGGTFHVALGAGYPETGSKNDSGLHWDMVCDLRKGGLVEVDGTVISKNGKFARATWPR